MSNSFSSQGSRAQHPTAPAMSAQRREKVVVGTVVRRPSEEVVEEMARIAVNDRARMSARAEETAEAARIEKARMTAQAPPTPLYPGRYQDGQHRRRPSPPINPAPTPSPERLRVAAVRRREYDEEERRFIDGLERRVGRPRTPTPPRTGTDPYGFAQWAQRRY